MHLHAAAMEGQLGGARLAPFAVQLAWAWLVLSMISLAIGHGQRRLRSGVLPWADRYPGHELLTYHLRPLAVTLGTIAFLLLVSEAAAVLNARTGFWLPTSTVAAVTLTALMFIWNWGRTQVTRHDSVTDTWYHAMVGPALAELRGERVAGFEGRPVHDRTRLVEAESGCGTRAGTVGFRDADGDAALLRADAPDL